jgi:two-component system cell cycle response regulator
VILDIRPLKTLEMDVIKLLVQAMQISSDLALQFGIVGHASLVTECKGIEDLRNCTFHTSLEEAQARTGGNAVPVPQLAESN